MVEPEVDAQEVPTGGVPAGHCDGLGGVGDVDNALVADVADEDNYMRDHEFGR